MAKKLEPAKSPTSTKTSPANIWLWARASLVAAALLSALPSPLSSMWGRPAATSSEQTLYPLLVAALWALVVYGTRRAHFADEAAEEDDVEQGAVTQGASGRGALGPGASNQGREIIAFWGLFADTLFLTALLFLGGAAHNPFTLLYFVPITLSTFLMGRAALFVALMSVVGFLILLARTRAALGHGPHAMHLFQHVTGMAVALGVSGIFLAYFMRQIARRLELQRRSLIALRQQLERDRGATALGALAAGAAHELGTPLGTVQLLVEELNYLQGEERAQATTTILAELSRAKEILHSMHSSELSAEKHLSLSEASIQQWLAALNGELEELFGLQFAFLSREPDDEKTSVRLPFSLIAQMVRELIENARRAGQEVKITLQAELRGKEIALCVRDDGSGMTSGELLRARQPFTSFSGGRGLGLFLIDVQLRQLKGRLEMTSSTGSGTEAVLLLPPEVVWE